MTAFQKISNHLKIVCLATLTLAGVFGITPEAAGKDPADAEVFFSQINNEKVDFLIPQKPLHFTKQVSPVGGEMVFDVKMNRLKQKVDGFGAAFTESCTMHIDKLSRASRNDLMTKFFSKEHGAGLDNMRLPIGATDFGDGSRGSYTYDDTIGNVPDPEFKHWDMSRDEKTFALIREAKKINPHLRVMISPWSAPAWMKDSGKINGGRLLREHYQNFANYLVKSIQEYRARDIPVTSMTVLNEPFFHWEGVPSMGMNFEEQAVFIRKYLGPTLEKKGVLIELWGHDHNWAQSWGVTNTLLHHPSTRKYLTGIAFHCYAGHRFEQVNPVKKYPDLLLMNTECTSIEYPGKDDEQSFLSWLQTYSVDGLRIGNTGGIAWNLCLDEKFGPNNWGEGLKGCQNCRGLTTIDFSKGGEPQMKFNPEYYAFAQVGKFTTPRSRVIEVKGGTDDDAHGIAIQNEDGKIIFVAENLRSQSLKFSIRGIRKDQMLTFELPPRSVATFVIRK